MNGAIPKWVAPRAASENIHEDTKPDFAEAYLASAAERWGVDAVASFDRSLDRVPSIQRVEPGAGR